MSLKSFPAQVCLYTAVIFAVMFWSGWRVQKTVYDRYPAQLEGVIVPVRDRARTEHFFHDLLDLPLLPAASGQTPGVVLPDNSKLFFREVSGNEIAVPEAPGTVAIVKVRNGLRKFQKVLVSRSGKPEFRSTRRNYLEEMDRGMISEVVERRWGEEFVACDPDGNRIVFLKPWRRSGSRY